MRQYPESLLNFIQQEEGNVQAIRNEANSLSRSNKAQRSQAILNRIHPSNSGEGLVWGAYYDSRGYLTAGSGTLISRNKRGSKQEKADISQFKSTYGIDPFTMSKDQAKSLISIKLEENVNDYLKSRHGKGVDYDSLPDQAKLAVGSLAYNIGGANLGRVGKNYSESLKEAASKKDAASWEKFRSQQENFHGKNIQEPGVMKRRKIESDYLKDIVISPDSSIKDDNSVLMNRTPAQNTPSTFDNVEELFKPQEQVVPLSSQVGGVINTIAANLNPLASAQASEDDTIVDPNTSGDQLPEDYQLPDQINKPMTKPVVDTAGSIIEETRFDQNQEQLNQSIAAQERTTGESLSRFGNHLVNSFLTENIVGSTVKREIINWNVDTLVDPTFDPTKVVGFTELTKGVPTENLKDILESSINEENFHAKLTGYKVESQARDEMNNYMQTNPISGFVGIGVASALDVTSFIPVTKMARMAGLTKSMKGIPVIARSMGAAVAENVIQDLIQESVLTQNSEIRKWDDGDILYGMVGGVVLGGASGYFKGVKTIDKFTRLAKRMNAEKNLDGINMMIESAKAKNFGDKTVNELMQVRKVIEQSLQREHQLKVMEEVKLKQEEISKGLMDTKRISIVKEHADFVESVDKKIAAERKKALDEAVAMKDTVKETKKSYLMSVNTLKEANKGIEKRLKVLKAEKVQNAAISNEITKLSRKLKDNNNRIKDGLKRSQTEAKRIKAERLRLIRKLERQGDTYTNDTIKALENSKVAKELELKNSLDEFTRQVESGEHPALAELLRTDSLNNIASDLGLPKAFNSIDDVDSVLGIRFNDSVGSARVKEVNPSEYMSAQDVNEMFNKTDPQLWSVVQRQYQESRNNPALGLASFNVNKDSVTAQMMRATRLNKLLTTESVVGRFALNKSGIRWSNNEFASAFYNWAAPDGVGRANGGKLSVIELQQSLQASYGGQLRTHMQDAIRQLTPIILSNKRLRSDLGLPSNDLAAKLMMMEAYFPEKVAGLLRDEMIEVGSVAVKYGDEVGTILTQWRTKFNKLSSDILADAKEAGVEGIETLDATDNWFHRTWDNKAAVEFDIKHGTEKMEQLIAKGMKEHLEQEGKEVTAAMLTQITDQAKKFAFGLRSKDTRVFMAADVDYQSFMRKLLESDTSGALDEKALKAEVKRIELNAANRKAKELARRKPINLTASIQLDDGSTFLIRDLLESNIVTSQASYLGSMSGRIASARNGITNTDLLDQWAERAVELERRRGNLDHASFIERSMREDIEAVKYGYAHREGYIDGSIGRLQKMAMKYNAARLMQYTGISSIAEMNTLIAEAGYKAVAEVALSNLMPLMKSYIAGGMTGKVFRNTMYDELSVITGVGLEDISFDAILSTSRMISASKVGRVMERVVDNAAKATKRTTGHIETTGRRLALNSLAINYGNIALKRDHLGNLLGGLSNVNLVELGLADLVNGKAVKNSSWDNIMESIRKHALDEDGNNALESGKNIKQFNITKWDLETRRKFSEVLVQQANHILVNPDSSTAKLWHNTWWGSVFNQFKSFANNAESKVAGHNLNQALQGYRMGELAEFSKLAQKYFWGAALGKLSLVTYGAINNAGREDWSERMEQYAGVDDFRDWTQALGRSSAITGLDSAVDTMIGLGNLTGHMQVDPLFESSTIGQSRDKLSWQTTATGQLAVGVGSVATGVLKGDFSKSGQQALKLSPFRRQLGVNQLLNAMGVD